MTGLSIGFLTVLHAFAITGCGGYRILKEGSQDTDRQKRSPTGGFGGILPRKMFEIEVHGNGISAFLRPSKRVIMSHFC